MIGIELTSGARLRIRGAVEPATGSAVLSALAGRAEVTIPIPSGTGVWLATGPYRGAQGPRSFGAAGAGDPRHLQQAGVASPVWRPPLLACWRNAILSGTKVTHRAFGIIIFQRGELPCIRKL